LLLGNPKGWNFSLTALGQPKIVWKMASRPARQLFAFICV